MPKVKKEKKEKVKKEKVKKEKKSKKGKKEKASKKATKVEDAAAVAEVSPRKKSSAAGIFSKMLGRKSNADTVLKKEQLVVQAKTKPTGKERKKEKKEKKGAGPAKSRKMSSAPKQLSDGIPSYRKGKSTKIKNTKRKSKSKTQIAKMKVGNEKRHQNKHFPGDVSYKYTSPDEVWVEFLGRKPEVNDFGNGARLMLDATDV